MGLKRTIRRRVVAISRHMYQKRWDRWDRAALAEWTEERLLRQLGPYYWLFVLGLHNSATTMLADVLARHPVIHGLPSEGQALTQSLPRSGELGVGRLVTQRLDLFRWTAESEPERALRIKFDWSFYYPLTPGILLEKTPQNSLRSLWLQRHFTPCRFIAIVRSPYAVCEGLRRRTGCDIEAAAEHWDSGNRIMVEDLRSLERSMLVSYEDFCADPAGRLAQIQRFLGLDRPFDPSCYQSKIKAPIFGGTRKPLEDQNPGSLARLSRGDIEAINRIAWPFAGTLGYEMLDPSAVGNMLEETHT